MDGVIDGVEVVDEEKKEVEFFVVFIVGVFYMYDDCFCGVVGVCFR